MYWARKCSITVYYSIVRLKYFLNSKLAESGKNGSTRLDILYTGI
jgi:hypothetical protein